MTTTDKSSLFVAKDDVFPRVLVFIYHSPLIWKYAPLWFKIWIFMTLILAEAGLITNLRINVATVSSLIWLRTQSVVRAIPSISAYVLVSSIHATIRSQSPESLTFFHWILILREGLHCWLSFLGISFRALSTLVTRPIAISRVLTLKNRHTLRLCTGWHT